MSSLEREPTKTAAVCANCGDTYVVYVSPDGSVDPIGVSECPCGDGDLRSFENATRHPS